MATECYIHSGRLHIVAVLAGLEASSVIVSVLEMMSQQLSWMDSDMNGRKSRLTPELRTML